MSAPAVLPPPVTPAVTPSVTPPVRPAVRPDDALHVHDRRCYWDVESCGWVCAPAAARSDAPPPAAP